MTDPRRDDPLAEARRPERVDLDTVQARVDAATEGPWAWEATGEKDNSWAVGYVMDEDEQPLSGQLETGQGIVVEGVCEGIDGNPADAAFIAHARTDLPALVAELRLAREVVEACRHWWEAEGDEAALREEAAIGRAISAYDQSTGVSS